jgi:glyoxylase-like metal-dependent hydrolase (beta-lactamase superfamily II)
MSRPLVSLSIASLSLAAAACAPTRVVPQRAVAQAPATSVDWAAQLAAPGPVLLRSEVSARWAVPLDGLVDTGHAEAAALPGGDVPIVLPVHVLTHPTAGSFVVDTGVDGELAAGGPGPLRGLVRAFASGIEPVASLGQILGDTVPAGVLLTHAHLDHVLGLPDLAPGVPVLTGPGELSATSGQNLLLRRTFAQVFDERTALQELDLTTSRPLGPIEHAWDLAGDGSLYALWTPGHTPGSISVLARTPEGPVLFTGDTCHTLWGWEHDVIPGSYTADAAGNRRSLSALQGLQAALPQLTVYVGHELDGRGTGVDELEGSAALAAR